MNQSSDRYRIHDKRDTFHWSEDYNPERFKRAFGKGDIIVGLDPQERLGEGTLLVSEVTHDRDLVQRGLFWRDEEAFRYAVALQNRPPRNGHAEEES